MKYRKELVINKIFYSIQGEGFHSGKPAVFVRFAKCNLACDFCDTEFLTGEKMSVDKIYLKIIGLNVFCDFVVLTGGEPALYDLKELTSKLRANGIYTAIETNGLRPIYGTPNWVCVSPKESKLPIMIVEMDEVKYIIKKGDPIPSTAWILACDHYWISPMNETAIGKTLTSYKCGEKACTVIDGNNIKYCVDLVKDSCGLGSNWKLNIQMHKVIGVE